jgi:hypothetical protein
MYPESGIHVAPQYYDSVVQVQRSPFIQGFIAGLKGALLGAGGGSLVNALRGADPLKGALIGGLGTGIVAGLSKGVSQHMDNLNEESIQKYYAMRIKEREPAVYLPPPASFSQIFNRYHEMAHNKPMLVRRS